MLKTWRSVPLPAPAAHRVDNLANRVDHELRLLLVYLVAAVRVGDVLCVRHEPGELLLGLFLRGVISEVEAREHAISWLDQIRAAPQPPGHATKKVKRYRYYVSAPLLAGEGLRVSAGDIEALVLLTG